MTQPLKPQSLHQGWGFLLKKRESVIKIDEKEYELDVLSDKAKAQLASLQFMGGELQHLNAQVAVL
ncbi:MAG: hypothetical protein H7240_07755 [Glaciimonas sp.]|nr:hypothetical protein [Glaciimonas sp.]